MEKKKEEEKQREEERKKQEEKVVKIAQQRDEEEKRRQEEVKAKEGKQIPKATRDQAKQIDSTSSTDLTLACLTQSANETKLL